MIKKKNAKSSWSSFDMSLLFGFVRRRSPGIAHLLHKLATFA